MELNAPPDLDAALEKALEKVLGPQAPAVRAKITSDPRLQGMCFGQAALIWLDKHMPEKVSDILRVARGF